MYAVPYSFTRDFPTSWPTTIKGNQHAVNTSITIASVNANRRSTLLLTEVNVLPCVDACTCLFLLLSKNTEIVIDT